MNEKCHLLQVSSSHENRIHITGDDSLCQKNKLGMTSVIGIAAVLLVLSAMILSISSVEYSSTPLKSQLRVGNSKGTEKVVYIIRHGEKHRDPYNETAYYYACLSKKGYARANHLISVFGFGRAEPSLFSNDDHQLISPPVALFSFNYDNGNDCRDSAGVYRTQATLMPLSNALGLPINNITGAKPDLCGFGHIDDAPTDTIDINLTKNYNNKVCHPPTLESSVHDFGLCCNMAAAEAIKLKLFQQQQDGHSSSSSVLVAWEHANIGYLAEALMIDDNDNYISNDDIKAANKIIAQKELQKLLYWPDALFDKIFALYFDPVTHKFTKLDTTTFAQRFTSA